MADNDDQGGDEQPINPIAALTEPRRIARTTRARIARERRQAQRRGGYWTRVRLREG